MRDRLTMIADQIDPLAQRLYRLDMPLVDQVGRAIVAIPSERFAYEGFVISRIVERARWSETENPLPVSFQNGGVDAIQRCARHQTKGAHRIPAFYSAVCNHAPPFPF